MRGPSTPRLIGSVVHVSGMLDRPPSRTMTPECVLDTGMCVRVLATHCARGLNFPPSKTRAQGMPDARCTRDLVCELCIESCTRAYRAAENIRHSLRNGFTAYNELSPENGSFASVAP